MTLQEAARAALDADALVLESVARRPAHLGTDWLEWYDATEPVRADRRAAVRDFIGHPEYPAAHRRCWGDEITTGTTADVAWIPVARLVTNALM